MTTRNQDVREAIKKAKIRQWQIAEYMGVHENTLSRMLRQELPREKKVKIISIVKELEGVAVAN
jgi:predicted XRE-type DNA-binding protein